MVTRKVGNGNCLLINFNLQNSPLRLPAHLEHDLFLITTETHNFRLQTQNTENISQSRHSSSPASKSPLSGLAVLIFRRESFPSGMSKPETIPCAYILYVFSGHTFINNLCSIRKWNVWDGTAKVMTRIKCFLAQHSCVPNIIFKHL